MKSLPVLLSKLNLMPDMNKFLENFEIRKIFQKTVYLLQELGINLGYHFGWYLNGPYSTSLADDGYEMAGLRISSKNIRELRTELPTKDIHDRISILFKDLDLENVESAQSLELLASLHFILKHAYPKTKSSEEAKQKLKKSKPNRFDDQEIDMAMDALRKAGLAE